MSNKGGSRDQTGACAIIQEKDNDGLDQGSRNTKHKKGSILRFVYRLDMESEKKNQGSK